MSKNVLTIEGIGPKNAQVLAAAGITTTDALLKAACNKGGRKELSEKTGISEPIILKWANMSDLFRIKGVAGQYAELLEAAGVDTVKELRSRNANNLAEKFSEINRAKRVVRQVPSEKSIQDWIKQAKILEPMITH